MPLGGSGYLETSMIFFSEDEVGSMCNDIWSLLKSFFMVQPPTGAEKICQLLILV